jgi:hypothetical protein
MVFKIPDLNELANICVKLEAVAKELKDFCARIEEEDCTRLKPDFDAVQALTEVNQAVEESSVQSRIAQLLAEIAFERSQEEISWDDIYDLEMMIMEYSACFQIAQRKNLFGR